MTIRIDSNVTIKQIQQAFSGMFPFLKIEFFRKPHTAYQASHRSDLRLSSEKALVQGSKATPVEIELDSHLKVRELEQLFSGAGLSAQVFRKSGNVWIETSLTDDWTLGQQNSEGESLSKPIPKTSYDINDNA